MNEYSGFYNGDMMSLGIIVARQNETLSGQLARGAIDCLERHGVHEDDITITWVPTVNEIPLIAQQMAFSGHFDALICLGALECDSLQLHQVTSHISQTSLETGLPVISKLLTIDLSNQEELHAGTKGFDTALIAIEMVSLSEDLLHDLYEIEAEELFDEDELKDLDNELLEETKEEVATSKNGKKRT